MVDVAALEVQRMGATATLFFGRYVGIPFGMLLLGKRCGCRAVEAYLCFLLLYCRYAFRAAASHVHQL